MHDDDAVSTTNDAVSTADDAPPATDTQATTGDAASTGASASTEAKASTEVKASTDTNATTDDPASASNGALTTTDDEATAAAPPPGAQADPDAQADPGAQAQGRRRFRPSVSRRVWIHLAVLLGYMVAALLLEWTRESYLFSQRLPYGRDTGLYDWDYWWMAHCVTHLTNPFFSYFQAAPTGVPLGFHTMMPLEGALMTPFTLAYGAGFSLNLMVFISPGLTCYAMYRVARLWLPTQVGAIAAGALFGFCTIIAWNDWWEAQLALGQIFLPLLLEVAIRMSRRPTWRMGALVGLVMGVALLTDQESTILAATVAGLALLPWLFRRPGRGGFPLLVKLRVLVIAGVVFVVIGSPQLLAMYIQGKDGYDTVPPGALAADYHNSGTTLQQIFAPSPRLGFFGFKSLYHYYYTAGPGSATLVCYGVVLSLLALLGLIVCWRRHGVRLLGLLWLVGTALALGTTLALTPQHHYTPFAQVWHGIRVSLLMPYTWVIRLSFLSSFREANRLDVLGLVGAALLAAAAVDWVCRHSTPALVVVAVLAVFELGSVGAGNHPPTALGADPTMSMPINMPKLDGPIAADHSGSIVVDIPLGVRSAVPIPNEGMGFDPEVQVQAVADGHPRTVAYVSRMSVMFLNRVRAIPFYSYLFALQEPYSHTFSHDLFGRHGQGSAELTEARASAYKLHVGWAIFWPHKHPEKGVLRYLLAVGFKYQYTAYGDSVYRLPPRSSGTA